MSIETAADGLHVNELKRKLLLKYKNLTELTYDFDLRVLR